MIFVLNDNIVLSYTQSHTENKLFLDVVDPIVDANLNQRMLPSCV